MTKAMWAGLAGVMLMAAALAAQKPEAAETLLQTAIKKEVVDGNLNGAIEGYKKALAAAKDNRVIAVQALLHMAACYQKLGDAQARKVYERIVREFGDQAQAVAAARARLGTSTGEAATRRVWTAIPGADLGYSSASNDGRMITYIDYDVDNLFVHDLVTDTTRQVTDSGAPGKGTDFPEENAFSRDGKQLAYAWYKAQDRRWEVRAVDLAENGIPRFRRLYDNEEIDWIGPDDWSPDGKSVAVQIYRKDHRYQIGVISAQDGSLRVLKTRTDHRAAERLLFSPDGRYLAYDQYPDEVELQRDLFVMRLDGAVETTAVAGPSEDVLMGWSPDGTRLIFRSDRTGEDRLWSQTVVDGKPQGIPEILRRGIVGDWALRLTSSGGLITQVRNGLTASLRVADFDFRTGQFSSQPADPVRQFVGTSRSPSWSPDGKSLAYLSGKGRRTLAVQSLETGSVRRLDIRMRWIGFDLAWSPDGRSFAVPGQDLTERPGIYRVDAQTGEVTPLAQTGEATEGRQFDSPAWSPDGSKLYYRRVVRVVPGIGVAFIERDLSTGRERELIQRANLGPVYLSPDGRFIVTGTWDTGTKPVSCLLIPTNGDAVKELMRVNQPDSLGGIWGLDGIWGWSPDSRFVLVRKRTGANPDEVWRIPVDGSAPQKLDVRVDQSFRFLRVNPDQRRVAFDVQETPKPDEVWIMENFLPKVPARK